MLTAFDIISKGQVYSQRLKVFLNCFIFFLIKIKERHHPLYKLIIIIIIIHSAL